MNKNKYLIPELRFLDPRTREVEPSKGDLGAVGMAVKAINEQERSIEFVCSTGNVDRYEEIIDPSAFKELLPVFETNPVFLAGHQHSSFTGEPTVIGHWRDLKITSDGLVGKAHFANTPLAETYWQLYIENHMRAVSVGFITHEWEMREINKNKIRVFTKVELIEISAVAVPANREALARAASFVARGSEIPGQLEQTEVAGWEEVKEQLKALREGLEGVNKQLKIMLAEDGSSPLVGIVSDAMDASRDWQMHDQHDAPRNKSTKDDGSQYSVLAKALS